MVDYAGNELDPPYEEEFYGRCGGVLRFLDELWDFICSIVSAIAEAVMKVLSFILDMIINAVTALIQGLVDALSVVFESTVMNIASTVKLYLNSHPTLFGEAAIIVNDDIFGTMAFDLMTAAMYGLMAFEVLMKSLPGTAIISQLIVPIILSAIAGALAGIAAAFIVQDFSEDWIGALLQAFGLLANLAFFFLMLYAKFCERAKKFKTLVEALGESLLALGIEALSGAVEKRFGKGSITSRAMDMLGWLLAAWALGDLGAGLRDPWLRLTPIWKNICTGAVLLSFGSITAYLG